MLERLAALSAAIAIAAGAFGAHRLTGKEAEWLRTGGLYQLVHAVAVLALARHVALGPLWTLFAGATLFAATLYAMAFGAPRWLGAITPIGGALMILGWLLLAWRLR
ncbi:DUF423 domain-containing protein [Sphingomonas sp.]|jgi:uncharacterized membrane protein YgdD (TMEM256/DUF423 family)|uniref:DUF423 domain-containing protein n=1 Tax=Sphingomonas sp. TaxID=28214 RepID=UPI002DE5B426|nr:DUF423 domain-containing protein [Sphingomonas sp.]